MDAIRVGFIGLGGIATRSHLPAVESITDFVIQAGAEVNTYQAERTQRRFHIPKIYPSYKEMLEEESLDAIYICLPNSLHFEATSAALAQGLHVYCEKPMGLSSKEAMGLVSEADRQNVVLMPGYNLRFHTNFLRARRLIEEKRIGKILLVHGVAAKPGPYIGWDPKSDWYFNQQNGGVLYDLGSHLVDLLLYIVDLDIDNINAISRTSLPGLPVPDNIVANFRDRHDIIGSLNIAWGAPANLIMIQIHGTAGTIIVSDSYFEHITPQNGGLDRIVTSLNNIWETLNSVSSSIIQRRSNGTIFVEISRNFMEAIQGKSPLKVSTRDSIKTHRTLEAIRYSLSQNKINID